MQERLGRHADALDDYDQAILLDGSFAEALHARQAPLQDTLACATSEMVGHLILASIAMPQSAIHSSQMPLITLQSCLLLGILSRAAQSCFPA